MTPRSSLFVPAYGGGSSKMPGEILSAVRHSCPCYVCGFHTKSNRYFYTRQHTAHTDSVRAWYQACAISSHRQESPQRQ